ncbi:MAG: riboflavin synthase [Chloroflexota bacterium]|nr:riboflavin synthase [Dehalococcoidia bacterium]MDW8252789.1 riboflavin synthase [Chloroflexota bacterium]
MFSGIVEELGTVRARTEDSLVIRASTVLEDMRVGDSIAVNGACLTVVAFGADWFRVEVVPETWGRTNLGDCSVGDPVNLERSLRADGRIGGHFVQGHVDGTAALEALTPRGNEVVARFGVAPAISRYIVNKGFIALDGVSLTVVETGADWFTIALIPHTRAVTTLGVRRPGDRVNVEVDIVGKYVERFVAERIGSLPSAAGV